VNDLLINWRDGRVKLYLIWKGLQLRRERRATFLDGNYCPLAAAGEQADHVVAFARDDVIAIAPRLFGTLLDDAARDPLGAGVWTDTTIALPREFAHDRYRNVLTGEELTAGERDREPALRLAEVLASFPVALLIPA
jgi:(1->4)-alpha-D-glucan 1-alpha-D-glucosylmutase